MSDITQNILFPDSGLNTDDDLRFVGLGDAPYRLNILIGEDGANGVITNSKGNRLADHYPLEECNAYQVVGSYYNQLTRKCYFFVFSQPHDWSTSGDYEYDNHLLVFDEDLETIENVFTDTHNWFGLDLWHPVKDCDMLGDMLYFNTRVSEPKMIDVVRAKNYTDYTAWQVSPKTYNYGDKVRFFGGVFFANQGIPVDQSPAIHPTWWDRIGDCYQEETDIDFDSEFRYAFNVIRHIPVYRPICDYGTDTTKNSNNIRGKVFRFTHRYQYFDDTYSIYGAYSDVTLPIYDERYNGEVIGDINLFNYISVFIPLHSAALIKGIEIIVQETGGYWKRAKLINRWEQSLLDDINYTYKFYNNESYPLADENLLKEPFDSVPKIAATQELINKNILSYGGCTEGFDNIDKDEIRVTLTPEIEAISIDKGIDTLRRNNLDKANDDWDVIWDMTSFRIISWLDTTPWLVAAGIAPGDVYVLTAGGKTTTYVIQAGDTATPSTLASAIVASMSSAFKGMTANTVYAGYNIPGAVILSTTSPPIITQSKFYKPSGVSVAELTKKRGFKTGAWHPFCLFYYDEAMRRWDAQTSKENVDGAGYSIDGTTTYVPMFNEISPAPSTANKWHIDWEVGHLPPADAKWWRWGYAGNSLCSYFVQYTITSIADESPWSKVNIAPLQTLKTTTAATWNQFPQSIIEPYQWTQGDRVRFITEKSAGSNIGGVVEGVYDYEIVKYDDTTVVGEYMIYVQLFGWNSQSIGADSLIEIYRPIKTDTERVYYEFGELMPIIEDGAGVLVHGGGLTGTADQVFATSTPASGTFSAGDIYHILRTPSKPIDTTEGYFHESQWYSDFYKSDDYDRGRIGVETSFGERTLNIVRYSNQYLQNTGINGLSTFEAMHYKELSDIYGSIQAMMEVGTTLKVYMEKKSASILIGRQEYMDSAGKVTIATSDVVLGAIRYPEDNFGTQWIESVTKNNRYVYGFDVFNAVLWRDSANGLFPISGRFASVDGASKDYKMASWFKDKADALTLSGIDNVKVLTVWDERYKLLYVIFKDHANNTNNDTIVYHEPSDRWICFTDFEYTPVGGYNEMIELTWSIVTGFEGGLGYNWNEDTRFAEFDFVASVNATVQMPLAQLTLTPYDPIFSNDVSVAMEYFSMTLQAMDGSVTVTDKIPPASVLALKTLGSVVNGDELTGITLTGTYDNSGAVPAEGLKWTEWRLKDETGTVVNQGLGYINFLATVVAQPFSINAGLYPEYVAGKSYTIEHKLATSPWVDALVSNAFSSIDVPISNVILTLVDVPDGTWGDVLTATVTYDNSGDAEILAIDWRILDELGEYYSSDNTISFSFLGGVSSATFTLSRPGSFNIIYPRAMGTYYYRFQVKLSRDEWGISQVTDYFTSL
jgi:hypothetical protein